jgi:hypothetical protein
MIRDLFVPTKIGSYYIIPQHIIGIDASNPNQTLAARITAMAETLAIEQCVDFSVTNNEKPLTSIEHLLQECPSCVLYSCISSEHVIFKTFTLPFTKREQIAQVIAYEVEPTLPFPLKNAVFDFIVTHIDPIQKRAEVLVATIQKRYLQQHLDEFLSIGKLPVVVTIDMIAVYEFFRKISYYVTYKGALILIVLSRNNTKLAYVVDGILKFVRVVPDSYKSDTSAMQPFWNQINFTLNSFSSQVGHRLNSKIVLIEQEEEYKGVEKDFQKATEIKTELFDVSQLLRVPHLISEVSKAKLKKNLISIAVAMPSIEENGFNINKLKETGARTVTATQMITISALIFVTLAALCASYVFQVYRFKKAVSESSLEAITTLVDTFGQDVKPKTVKNPVKELQRTVDAAQHKVADRQKLWFAFSAPAQVAFLRYLYELFTGLDHQKLGLEIEKLNIKEGTLTLKGHVKDFEALEQFDAYIKTAPLLNKITRGDLQSPSFDIDIELNPNGEDDE